MRSSSCCLLHFFLTFVPFYHEAVSFFLYVSLTDHPPPSPSLPLTPDTIEIWTTDKTYEVVVVPHVKLEDGSRLCGRIKKAWFKAKAMLYEMRLGWTGFKVYPDGKMPDSVIAMLINYTEVQGRREGKMT